jgi:hypothetical protein
MEEEYTTTNETLLTKISDDLAAIRKQNEKLIEQNAEILLFVNSYAIPYIMAD